MEHIEHTATKNTCTICGITLLHAFYTVNEKTGERKLVTLFHGMIEGEFACDVCFEMLRPLMDRPFFKCAQAQYLAENRLLAQAKRRMMDGGSI
jgi:hypothetical protein